MREVNALSKMSHHHIVRYYTVRITLITGPEMLLDSFFQTWIEAVPMLRPSPGPGGSESSEEDEDEDDEDEDEDGDDWGNYLSSAIDFGPDDVAFTNRMANESSVSRRPTFQGLTSGHSAGEFGSGYTRHPSTYGVSRARHTGHHICPRRLL